MPWDRFRSRRKGRKGVWFLRVTVKVKVVQCRAVVFDGGENGS